MENSQIEFILSSKSNWQSEAEQKVHQDEELEQSLKID